MDDDQRIAFLTRIIAESKESNEFNWIPVFEASITNQRTKIIELALELAIAALPKGIQLKSANLVMSSLIKLLQTNNDFDILRMTVVTINSLLMTSVALDGTPFIKLFKFPAFQTISPFMLSIFLDKLSINNSPPDYQLVLINVISTWVNNINSVHSLIQCLPGISGSLAKVYGDSTRPRKLRCAILKVLSDALIITFSDVVNNDLLVEEDAGMNVSLQNLMIKEKDIASTVENVPFVQNQKLPKIVRNIEWFQSTRGHLWTLFSFILCISPEGALSVSKKRDAVRLPIDVILRDAVIQFSDRILKSSFECIGPASRQLLLHAIFVSKNISLTSINYIISSNVMEKPLHYTWIRNSFNTHLEALEMNSAIDYESLDILSGYLYLFHSSRGKDWSFITQNWIDSLLNIIISIVSKEYESRTTQKVQFSTGFDLFNSDIFNSILTIIKYCSNLIESNEPMDFLFQKWKTCATSQGRSSILWIVNNWMEQSERKKYFSSVIKQWINGLYVDDHILTNHTIQPKGSNKRDVILNNLDNRDFSLIAEEHRIARQLVGTFALVLQSDFRSHLKYALPDILFHSYIQSAPSFQVNTAFDLASYPRLVPYSQKSIELSSSSKVLHHICTQVGYNNLVHMLDDCGGWLVHWANLQFRYPQNFFSETHKSWDLFKALGVVYAYIHMTCESVDVDEVDPFNRHDNVMGLIRDCLEDIIELWCEYSRSDEISSSYATQRIVLCMGILDVFHSVINVIVKLEDKMKQKENINLKKSDHEIVIERIIMNSVDSEMNDQISDIGDSILYFVADFLEKKNFNANFEDSFQEKEFSESAEEVKSPSASVVDEKSVEKKEFFFYPICRKILDSIQHGIYSDSPLIQLRILQIMKACIPLLYNNSQASLISYLSSLWQCFSDFLSCPSINGYSSSSTQLICESSNNSYSYQRQLEIIWIITSAANFAGDFFSRPISKFILPKYSELFKIYSTRNIAEISSRSYRFTPSYRILTALIESLNVMVERDIFRLVSPENWEVLILLGDLLLGNEQATEIRESVKELYRLILKKIYMGDWMYAQLLKRVTRDSINCLVEEQKDHSFWSRKQDATIENLWRRQKKIAISNKNIKIVQGAICSLIL